MSNPCCTICFDNYSEDNPPRILNKCPHTFCTRCISSIQNCPLDGIPIDLRRYKIDGFRVNTGLLKETKQREPAVRKSSAAMEAPLPQRELASRKSSAMVEAPPQQRPPVYRQEEINRCLLHDKPLDLVCVDHLKKICSGCALFGDHRGHKVETIEKVINECTNLAEQTINTLTDIDGLKETIAEETICERVNEELRGQRDQLVKTIRLRFKKLADRLRKLEVQAISQLDKLVEEQKERLLTDIKLEEITSKKDGWLEEAHRLIDIVEGMTRQKLGDDAARYINEGCQESSVAQRGDYLMIEISSFQTNVDNKLQRLKEDLVVEFDDKFDEAAERFAMIYRQSDRENLKQKQAEAEKKLETGEDYLLEEGLTISKPEELSPDTCETFHFQMEQLGIDEIEPYAEVTEVVQPLEVREVQESVSFASKESIGDLRRKKKLKLPEKYEPIVEDLRNDRCETIDLGGAELGDAVVISLCDYVRCSQRLRCLKLIRNKLTNDALLPILEACVQANVVSLNLGQNLMTDKAIEILERINLKKLQAITLSQNKLKERTCKPKIVEFKRRGVTLSI